MLLTFSLSKSQYLYGTRAHPLPIDMYGKLTRSGAFD